MSHQSDTTPRIGPETRRRVWTFARPYRTLIIGFLGVVTASSVLGVVPPLLFREIIDGAIANEDRGQLTVLGLLVVGAALAQAVLSFFERWASATVGEGLIFDLRVALFDHVQRLPVSFFTRTRTGALVSRLNNDVIGAQLFEEVELAPRGCRDDFDPERLAELDGRGAHAAGGGV